MKSIAFNPFPVSGYLSDIYFCNRELETEELENNIYNNLNTTLFAFRRIGKTGLINHVFYKINKESDVEFLYFDIFSTQNQADFTNMLSNEIFRKFPQNKGIGKKFLEAIKSFRPIISYDSLTGSPELSLDVSTGKVQERTIQEIFRFLDSQNTKIIIAIDEFQQILSYPEKNTEALLRTIMQEMKNVHFIFCGSNQSLMSEIFNSAKRPFYASCRNIYLDKIDNEKYAVFIKHHFEAGKRTITNESIAFILDWTCTHTYYTQYVCNRLFALGQTKIDLAVTQIACKKILDENEMTYFQFRKLLTLSQWNLLKALACETTVTQPFASNFIAKYQLGSSAQVKRSLDALLEKEMVYMKLSEKETRYEVYDKFLMRWFQD